jgi:hypothetical protein
MTHKQRVLRLLSDHKPHTHHELYQLGCVAHSRISDLRKDGHRILQWRENDLYLYRLESNVLESGPAPLSVTPPVGTGTSAAGPDSRTSSIPIPSSPSSPGDAADPHSDRGGDVLTLFGDAA